MKVKRLIKQLKYFKDSEIIFRIQGPNQDPVYLNKVRVVTEKDEDKVGGCDVMIPPQRCVEGAVFFKIMY